ncbi:MAG TPA: hypothetical protein C5S51_00950 [Methanosarcinaceae archaeon]|nr:hypothetical protein [Methanosarcinaceae archaeon]
MVDMPVVYTYYGTVVGYPESKVRFTVSDDAILGWIEVDDVKYIVSQSGSVKINEETKVLHTVYRNIDKEIAGIPVGADDVVEVPHDEYLIDNIVSSTSTMTILSTTTVDLLAVYDTEFSNEFASPGTEIYNMIADVNDAYGVSDISVNLDIDYYYYDSDLSSTSSSNLLYEFKNENSALRNSQNCDLAFLFSGKEFSDVPIGRAFQYTGSSTEGYAIGQMVNAPGYVYDGTFDERCILIAHEIGHNFGARHQIDTAPPSYAKAYNWKYLGYYDRYTSMWYPYKGIGILSGMQLEFSSDTNHGDSTHDNARRIVTIQPPYKPFILQKTPKPKIQYTMTSS